jgi:polysaccharide export outer membrane protein
VKAADLSSISELTREKKVKTAHGMVVVAVLVFTVCAADVLSSRAFAQTSSAGSSSPESSSAGAAQPWQDGTAAEINRRLEQLAQTSPIDAASYRVGPDDLLDISVFDVPELSRTVRVSASGDISLPLLGRVSVAGQTPQDLEASLADQLRAHYMKDPQVTVFVHDMESHGVSVFGAVLKPGVYQIRGAKSLVEVLSVAGGLADNAGDTVTIVRGGGADQTASAVAAIDNPAPQAGLTAQVNIAGLLAGDDPKSNVLVYPGDVVKVAQAGTVYVVGEVRRPGGFVLHASEKISVLQAISLAEGLTGTAARSQARIIRTDPATGKRTEIALNLGRVLSGKAADPELEARDIVFVPNSAARSGLYRGGEALVQISTGIAIYHPF